MNTIKPTSEMLEVLKHIKPVVDVERPIVNAILRGTPFTIHEAEELFDYYIHGIGLNLNKNNISEVKLYWLIKNSSEYKKYKLNKILTN